MKNEMILVLGGARSGKSSWALRYAEEHYSSCIFLATAEVTDEEMEERIRLHKEARGPQWGLVEEPVNLSDALEKKCKDADVVLIDCMTIWQSNILMKLGCGPNSHASRETPGSPFKKAKRGDSGFE